MVDIMTIVFGLSRSYVHAYLNFTPHCHYLIYELHRTVDEMEIHMNDVEILASSIRGSFSISHIKEVQVDHKGKSQIALREGQNPVGGEEEASPVYNAARFTLLPLCPPTPPFYFDSDPYKRQ